LAKHINYKYLAYIAP